MAEQRTEVTLALTFDDQASKGLGGVADKAAAVEASAKKAQKQLTDLQEAHRRLATNDREARIRGHMDRAEAFREHSQWQAQPWYARSPISPGMRGAYGVAAGAAAVGLGGLGLGATEIQARQTAAALGHRGQVGYGETLAALTDKVIDAVPVIGDFTRSLRQGISELANWSSTIAGLRARQSMADIRHPALMTSLGAAAGGAMQLDALGAGAAAARISAEGAAAFAGGMTPAQLASYRPRGYTLFDEPAGMGGLRFARDRAEAEAAAARRNEAERAWGAEAALGEAGEAGEIEGVWGRAAQRRSAAAAEAQKQVGWRIGPWGKGAAERAAEANAAAIKGNQGAELAGADAQAARDRARQQADLLQGAGVNRAEAEARAFAAQTGVMRGELGWRESVIANTRSGLIASGAESQADTAGLLQLAKIGRANWDALSNAQKSQLLADPRTGQHFQKVAQEAGAANPFDQELRQMFPTPFGAGLGEQEKGRDRLADEIARRDAQQDANRNKAVADALDQHLGKISTLIVKAVERMAGNVERQVNDALERQRLGQNPGRN